MGHMGNGVQGYSTHRQWGTGVQVQGYGAHVWAMRYRGMRHMSNGVQGQWGT